MKNSLANTHPTVAKEWHKNKNGEITPFDITYGIGKKVWWICSEKHEWLATPNDRTNKKGGCPYCVGRKPCETNCLANLNKNIAAEWHPTKNLLLTPYLVTCHYSKKVWWQCKSGHEWLATVDKRSNGRKCPYCSNKKINYNNSFEAKNPKIAKEWHPTKNDDLKPSMVAPNCGKKVWWQCKEKHEWKVRICDRNRSGCPVCKSSKSQKILFKIIKEIFPTEDIKYNYTNESLRYTDTNRCVQLDIYIINKKVAIEYQGEQHFKPIKYWGGYRTFNRIKNRDERKKNVCKENNIILIEVLYTWKKDKETIIKLMENYV